MRHAKVYSYKNVRPLQWCGYLYISGIDIKFLKDIVPVIFSPHPQNFQRTHLSSLFPKGWKDTIIIVITKPNKDPSLLNNYHPIYHLDVFEKIFEENRRGTPSKIIESPLPHLGKDFPFVNPLSITTNEVT